MRRPRHRVPARSRRSSTSRRSSGAEEHAPARPARRARTVHVERRARDPIRSLPGSRWACGIAKVVSGDEEEEERDFVLSEIKASRPHRAGAVRSSRTCAASTCSRVRSTRDAAPGGTVPRRAARDARGEGRVRACGDAAAVPHDADQMQQVFINLVKNAAEASAPGSTITVRAEAHAANGRGRRRARRCTR